MSNSSLKKGDYVINWFEDEGMVHIGQVSEDPVDGEHDLDFIGGGSVSPVDAKESIVIPKSLAILLDKILNAIPTDDDGMFLLAEETIANAEQFRTESGHYFQD